MSPKELLYIEDVLGHAKELETACKDFANMVQDSELKSFIESIAQKNKCCFDKVYELVCK